MRGFRASAAAVASSSCAVLKSALSCIWKRVGPLNYDKYGEHVEGRTISKATVKMIEFLYDMFVFYLYITIAYLT